jgi:hypothetical protein
MQLRRLIARDASNNGSIPRRPKDRIEYGFALVLGECSRLTRGAKRSEARHTLPAIAFNERRERAMIDRTR